MVRMNDRQTKRIPISEDLLTSPLDHLEQVRLKGTKCHNCGEVFFGKYLYCENCGSGNMEAIVLSKRGKLSTYTIIEHIPPGNYKGPRDPFIPFGEGLVALPDGCKILSPLTVNREEDIKIGMDLELVIDKLYEDEDHNEVIAFKFKPLQRRFNE